MRVLEILADATNVIAEGEVLQLMNAGNADARRGGVPRRDPAQDREAVRGCRAAGRGAGRAPIRAREDALARYGMHLGTAFQIMDDVLDYSGDAAAIGKNLGDDLAEGKMTLPLIRALAVGTPDDAARDPARDRGRRAHRLRARDGRAGAHRRARRTPASAPRPPRATPPHCLDGLPPSPAAKTLLQLAAFAVDRRF